MLNLCTLGGSWSTIVPGIRLHDETLENALRRSPGHAAYLPSLGCPFCQGHQLIVAVPSSSHVGMPLHAGVHKVGRDNITMRKVSTGADVLNDCHVPASHDLVHSVTDTICGAKLHSHLPTARQHFSQLLRAPRSRFNEGSSWKRIGPRLSRKHMCPRSQNTSHCAQDSVGSKR